MYTPINQWAEDDRPREKFLLKGKSTLSDSELLAILIGSGSRNESAVQLCQRILASSENNLNALGKMSVAQLMQFKGIGEANFGCYISITPIKSSTKPNSQKAASLELL